MKKTIALLLYSLILVYSLDHSLITASASFTNNNLGARAAGMGGAFIGLGQGPESILYNWAVPSKQKELFIKTENGKILDTPYYMILVENISNLPHIKMSYLTSTISEIEETSLDSNQIPYYT